MRAWVVAFAIIAACYLAAWPLALLAGRWIHTKAGPR